ncbi:MAG TPA: NAD-dependent epimerase/dehydratase [Pilimelia sp.]|nr:NAD-dependent epimerase/dehydratase [Pilimelia sp.]
MTTVTILGASGFLGSALTAALSARPGRLRVVSRRPAAVPADARADVLVHTADLADPAQVAAAVADADVVLNLLKHDGDWRGADRDPDSVRVNVATTKALVAAVQAGRRPVPPLCLFAGTVSQVGLPPDRPMDGTETDQPVTAYDRQKLEAERVLAAASAGGVLRGVSLRLPTVYGQGPAGGAPDVGVVASMVRRALAGQPLTIWGEGTVLREFVHVDDVVGAFLAAMDRPDPLAGRHWLIGTGIARTLRDALRMVARSVAAHTGEPAVPVVSTPPPAHATATDFRSVRINPIPFRVASGWSAGILLDEGIRRTVAALSIEHSRQVRKGALV